MHSITIRESREAGELRWGIVLIDEDKRPLFESTKPVSKGSALSIAKALKHNGSDGDAWSQEDGELKFALVSETRFRLLGKEEGIAGILEIFKNFLAKVEIGWDPPEADPACKEKEADRTPTVGIPGS